MLLCAAAATLMLETTTRWAVSGGLEPVRHLNPPAVLLAIGSVASLLGIFYALSDRLLLACALTSGVLGFVGAAHVNKHQVLDRPLAPWDLLEWRQVLALLGSMGPAHLGPLLLLGLGLIGLGMILVVSLRHRPRLPLPLPWFTRITTLILCVGYLGAMIGYRHPTIGRQFARLSISNVIWDPKQNVEKNGLILTLLMNARALLVHRPGYSQSAVEAVFEPYRGRPMESPQEKPDIVVYMAEAVFDPTSLGVRFSRDPMPNLRRVMAEHSSGTLVSPVFGGGTSEVEFEVLTGIPMTVAPVGAVPYQAYVKRPLEALPSVLGGQGYRTVAVHNFHRWYWSRAEVYPRLGFERFIALDEFPGIAHEGPYPSDEPLVDKVIAQFSEDPGRPLFVFAISMVTHAPYQYARAPEPEVTVLDELSLTTVHELENYASAVYRADHALGRLIDFLATRERKTLLVVFGDHLPALGTNRSVFRETGYLRSPAQPEDQRKMATVPVAFWTNYPAARRSIESGMPFLSPAILRAAGFGTTGYFALLEEVSEQVIGLRSDFGVDCAGRIFTRKAIPAELRAPIKRLELLGHDRLHGKGYSLPQPGQPSPPTPRPVVIESADFTG